LVGRQHVEQWHLLIDEHRLGQRRPLIRPVLFPAQHPDHAGVTVLTQGERRDGCGLACTDDDDRACTHRAAASLR
jgi:hypothetical protein